MLFNFSNVTSTMQKRLDTLYALILFNILFLGYYEFCYSDV